MQIQTCQFPLKAYCYFLQQIYFVIVFQGVGDQKSWCPWQNLFFLSSFQIVCFVHLLADPHVFCLYFHFQIFQDIPLVLQQLLYSKGRQCFISGNSLVFFFCKDLFLAENVSQNSCDVLKRQWTSFNTIISNSQSLYSKKSHGVWLCIENCTDFSGQKSFPNGSKNFQNFFTCF